MATGGIFIKRGMTVGIPAGGLKFSFGPDGKMKGDLTLHAHFDVCPVWLELAARHLREATEHRAARIAAWASNDADAKGETLQKEFESSMQAIMAAAIAIDAFYSVVSAKMEIPADLKKKWRNNRTSRYVQISEVLRQAFGLKPKGTKALRGNLKEIFRYRDLAIHPRGKLENPILHPELGVGVEWRFAYYRAENAQLIVDAAQSMIVDLIMRGKPTKNEIQKYAESLQKLIPNCT